MATLADFADMGFDRQRYLRDMDEVEPGQLWLQRVEGARLTKQNHFMVEELPSRFVAEQKNVPVGPLQEKFIQGLRQGLPVVSADGEGGVLTVKAMIVEARPGSRIARYLVGIMGAGKASLAVAVEVFEPGQHKPSLRIYMQDSHSKGEYGGNSVQLLEKLSQGMARRISEQIVSSLTCSSPRKGDQ